jgi:TOBE domain
LFLHSRQVFSGPRPNRWSARPLPEDAPLATAEGPPTEGTNWIAISAGDVMLLSPEDRAVASNRFAGTITSVTQRHDQRRARIALDGSTGLELDCELSARDRFLGSTSVAVDMRVELHVPPSAIVVFPEVRS